MWPARRSEPEARGATTARSAASNRTSTSSESPAAPLASAWIVPQSRLSSPSEYRSPLMSARSRPPTGCPRSSPVSVSRATRTNGPASVSRPVERARRSTEPGHSSGCGESRPSCRFCDSRVTSQLGAGLQASCARAWLRPPSRSSLRMSRSSRSRSPSPLQPNSATT